MGISKKLNWSFYCPHCDERLDNDGMISLQTATKGCDPDNIIILPAKIGEYKLMSENCLETKKGRKIKILCPECNTNLDSGNKNFSKLVIRRKAESGIILFSNRAGERCTYTIEDGTGILTAFGEHSEKYGRKDFQKHIHYISS